MMQPFGIVIEVVVSYVWRQCQKNGSKTFESVLKKHNNDAPPLWIRGIGTIWVVVWMVWSGAYLADSMYSALFSANAEQI